MRNLLQFQLRSHLMSALADGMIKNYEKMREDSSDFYKSGVLWTIYKDAIDARADAQCECMDLSLEEESLHVFEDLIDYINAQIEWLS